jgi:hypothetical protein
LPNSHFAKTCHLIVSCEVGGVIFYPVISILHVRAKYGYTQCDFFGEEDDDEDSNLTIFRT